MMWKLWNKLFGWQYCEYRSASSGDIFICRVKYLMGLPCISGGGPKWYPLEDLAGTYRMLTEK